MYEPNEPRRAGRQPDRHQTFPAEAFSSELDIGKDRLALDQVEAITAEAATDRIEGRGPFARRGQRLQMGALQRIPSAPPCGMSTSAEMEKGSLPTKRALDRSRTSVANAASISRLVLAFKTWICSPMARAAASTSLNVAVRESDRPALAGATERAFGSAARQHACAWRGDVKEIPLLKLGSDCRRARRPSRLAFLLREV
jgi:hypothetical protein